MSKTKKITSTIAKILAERVREKLSMLAAKMAETQTEKVMSSKEYVEFEKLRAQEREIANKLKKLEDKISEKYSTPMMKVKMNVMYRERPATVRISENNHVTVDSIRDSILLDDHFADSTVSHDEIIDNMVKKFI